MPPIFSTRVSTAMDVSLTSLTGMYFNGYIIAVSGSNFFFFTRDEERENGKQIQVDGEN